MFRLLYVSGRDGKLCSILHLLMLSCHVLFAEVLFPLQNTIDTPSTDPNANCLGRRCGGAGVGPREARREVTRGAGEGTRDAASRSRGARAETAAAGQRREGRQG